MKRTLLLSVSALAPASAFAADLPSRAAPAPPPAPVFVQVERWSGFYAGVGVGWRTSGSRTRVGYAATGADAPGFDSRQVLRGPGYFAALNEFDSLNCWNCLATPPNGYLANPNVSWPTSLGRRADGFIGALTAGYNWQRGAFVIGLEADVSFLRNRARENWSGFGSGAFAVADPSGEDGGGTDDGPLVINGIGNYRKYTEQGYTCEPTFPPPPNNRWTCTPPTTRILASPPAPDPKNGSLTEGDYTLAMRMSVRARTTWLSTARVRAGFTTGPVFFYATGGLAVGGSDLSMAAEAIETLNVRMTAVNPPSPPSPSSPAMGGAPPVMQPVGTTATQTTVTTWTADRSRTEVGYALGAGMEWALDGNWSLKGEYVYYNLGTRSLRVRGTSVTTGTGLMSPVTEPAAPITLRHRFDGHTVRVGLNYRFGGPAAAVMGPVVAAY